jgi:osmoprotectant transport system ATP-binding protein
LKLQQKIRKTIVFVTHDIDEALRLGDRIAIFDAGSRLAQFDTPLSILTEPADEFVRDFVGSGASVRRLSLLRIQDIAAVAAEHGPGGPGHTSVDVAPTSTVQQALERVLSAKADGVCVTEPGVDDGVGADREPSRFIALQDLLVAAARTPGARP